MRHLAGRYLNAVTSSPLQSTVAGGLATAGLSVGGNLASEEGRDKGAARIALEALGAGALGAGVGSRIPALKKEYGSVDSAKLRKGLDKVVTPQTMQEVVQQDRLINAAQQASPYAGSVIAGTGLLAAGGLGGQIGGGVANLGNMAGLAIDPESPGSSNTQGSRMSMQTQQLPMY
jgi:hypothetical protein